MDSTIGSTVAEGYSATPHVGLARSRMRARLLRGFSAGLVIAAIGYGFYDWQAGSSTVSTENAYVGAVFAQVTPQIDGTIQTVRVHDTQYVHQGEVLLTLDRRDAELDFEAAKAAHESAYRGVQQNIADIKAAEANVLAKEALQAQVQEQLRRRINMGLPGVVPAEEIANLRSALDGAKYALSIARQQLAGKRAVVRQEALPSNPDILAAEVNLRRSQLRLERTVIRAPIDGIVAQSHVQIGQKIAPGAELMTVVPTGQLFVDANFKESQIKNIRAGQLVTLTSDIYGSGRVFHGHVQGVGGGTGATFAVIPPQNATGNWIKVVQRLPVRIALDQNELKKAPLRAGISMTAQIHLDQYVAPPAPRGNRRLGLKGTDIALRTAPPDPY